MFDARLNLYTYLNFGFQLTDELKRKFAGDAVFIRFAKNRKIRCTISSRYRRGECVCVCVCVKRYAKIATNGTTTTVD